MKKLILAAALLLPISGWAKGDSGFHAGLGLYMANSLMSGDNGSEIKSSTTNYDLKLGYLLSNGLYLGAAYHMGSFDIGGAATPARSAYGVAFGYHRGGWYIDANYYLSATVNDFTPGANLIGGSGFGADLGYNIFVNNNFYVGFGLTYKSLAYKQTETAVATTDFELTQTEMHPVINLGAYF